MRLFGGARVENSWMQIVKDKTEDIWGAWLAQHSTLNLKVVSSSIMLGLELT